MCLQVEVCVKLRDVVQQHRIHRYGPVAKIRGPLNDLDRREGVAGALTNDLAVGIDDDGVDPRSTRAGSR